MSNDQCARLIDLIFQFGDLKLNFGKKYANPDNNEEIINDPNNEYNIAIALKLKEILEIIEQLKD